MTHQAEHVVVRAATPIEVAGVKTSGGIVCAVLLAIGVLVGALLF